LKKLKRYLQIKFGKKVQKKHFTKENFAKIHSKNLKSDYLERDVHIEVYLPPSYFSFFPKKYPLLLFNDGQDLEAINIDSVMTSLYAQNSIQELIVVGIYPKDRIHEYGTAEQRDYANRGSKAPNYTAFVIQELIPHLKESYRCKADPSVNTFAGFSLGGLSAIDIVWNNPTSFGKVGIFSGALWWRSKVFDKSDPDANRIMHHIIAKGQRKKALQFWFQAGTNDEKEDRNNNGVIDAIDDTLDLIKELKRLGYNDTDIKYVEVLGGEHNPKTWGAIMPDFLKWAYGK